MTYAPADLKAIRQWLIATLNPHPGNVSADLEPDEVGIAGDAAHLATGGYHLGNDDLAKLGRLTSDYSKRQSSRDRPGTNAASGLDIGQFAARGWTLPTLSVAIVEACKRGDPRTRDVREVIFSPDGRTVKRWDRLGQSTTGDGSHRWHTHLSFFRDSEGRRDHPDNILGLLRELLGQARTESTTSTPAGDDMARQMLIKADGKLWLVDGMHRRAVPDTWYNNGTGPISDQQVHQTALLGPLGTPFQTGGDLDVWGIDVEARIAARVAEAVAGIKPTLTDAQVNNLATQVATALAAAPDVPLGDADKPAIEAALRNVLRTGVDQP